MCDLGQNLLLSSLTDFYNKNHKFILSSRKNSYMRYMYPGYINLHVLQQHVPIGSTCIPTYVEKCRDP